MSELEFKCAMDHHLEWKRRLRGFLDGREEITEAEAVSSRDCDLGKWLSKEISNDLRDITSIRDLQDVHEKLHNRVRFVLEKKYSGDPKAAEEGLAEMEELSSRLITLIGRVEKEMKERDPA